MIACMSGDSADWTAEQLAAETDTSAERIGAMVEAGILRPRQPDRFEAGDVPPAQPDRFEAGDVQRVLVANAMDEAGLTLDLLRRGIELGIVSFEQTPVIYPDPGPRSSGTVAELAADLGVPTETLLRVITALGLPRPDPETHLHVPDEEQLRAFFRAWQPLGGEELLLRAARVYGDSLRRAAEGWMNLFEEVVVGPIADRAVPWSEMSERAVVPGMPVIAAGRSMLGWLVDQHSTQSLNRLNFDAVERMLGLLGVPAAPRAPAAVVFADLVGYTRLTEERGDEVAASTATRLAIIADEIAAHHHGRLVKLLGDGVMLHFARPEQALPAALELRDAMTPAGLPAAHTGIHAGPVIRRESDYFGRTVNVAARLASQAGPHEILLTPELLEAAGRLPDGIDAPEPMAPLALKGIPEPVAALRIAPTGG